jgi:hypothetical protein
MKRIFIIIAVLSLFISYSNGCSRKVVVSVKSQATDKTETGKTDKTET